jgi:hypothetical protein
MNAMDLERLHNRVFGSVDGPDANDPKWKTALFVTPRNVVRQGWNHQCVVRHLATTEKQVFVSRAIDTDVPPQYRDRVIWEIDANTAKLATWTLLCVDGPVVVTTNIAVELGIANGTRAIVKEVVPHPLDETGWYQTSRERLVFLSRPPICVRIQPVTQNNGQDDITSSDYSFYEGNEDRRTWFPILATKPQEVKIKDPKITFKRVQIPLTPCKADIFPIVSLIVLRLCIVRSSSARDESKQLHH